MSKITETSFRPVAKKDAQAVMDIYNREVLGSRVTLDLVPRTLPQQLVWIDEHQGAYPAIVATVGEQVVGFASVSSYRIRHGYSTTVEDSVYVHPEYRGRGIGKQLLERIVERATVHGFHACMARIVEGHHASLALHASLGFFVVGTEREVGRKFGQWISVVLLERMLNT